MDIACKFRRDSSSLYEDGRLIQIFPSQVSYDYETRAVVAADQTGEMFILNLSLIRLK